MLEKWMEKKKSERTPRGGWKTAISDITGSLKIIKVILPKDENRSKAACHQEGHYLLACLKVDRVSTNINLLRHNIKHGMSDGMLGSNLEGGERNVHIKTCLG